MPWTFNPTTHNYRDAKTGRFVSSDDIIALSSQSLDRTLSIADQLARLLTTDQLTLRDWEILMRQEIKTIYIIQYFLGRGGLGLMTQADWGSLGGMLARQYRFLSGFADDVRNGRLTEAQIAARSQLYFNSARQAFSKARARTLDWPELPAHPGDGTTVCLTNCRCHWRPDRSIGPTEFYWELDFVAEHCSSSLTDARGRPMGCLERATVWNPYVPS